MPQVNLSKHSVTIAGHRTSLSLLMLTHGVTTGGLFALVARLDGGREGNLSSTLRVAVLNRLKARLPRE